MKWWIWIYSSAIIGRPRSLNSYTSVHVTPTEIPLSCSISFLPALKCVQASSAESSSTHINHPPSHTLHMGHAWVKKRMLRAEHIINTPACSMCTLLQQIHCQLSNHILKALICIFYPPQLVKFQQWNVSIILMSCLRGSSLSPVAKVTVALLQLIGGLIVNKDNLTLRKIIVCIALECPLKSSFGTQTEVEFSLSYLCIPWSKDLICFLFRLSLSPFIRCSVFDSCWYLPVKGEVDRVSTVRRE